MYKLELHDDFEKSISANYIIGNKRALTNENSAYLWHMRLGHISKERIQSLVKCDILPSLNFNDFDVCIDCLKGKMTKHQKKGATRSSGLLEIIHTDICGLFDIPTFGK